ncbi:CSS-motif domain-containing protein [Pseudomonas baltica]|uniref:CSS-motif domain-containing protein n=1 Tax=Pseudomonas baltica TaxID=2762576 RepID=UPI002896FEA8|nr:CSS-motif domain-containing protein [Pseudomonas baltica]
MTQHRPQHPRSARTFKLKPLLLSALVGLIPVISGMLILYWQVDRSLMRDSLAAGQRAIANIDRTLERADDVTARAFSLAGQECSAILEPMRRLVVGYPSVRSIVMGDSERLYCGSELGEFTRPVTPDMNSTSKLILRTASTSMPEQPSLLFRRFEGRNSVNAVIDALVLGENLAHARNGATVLLEHNGLFLDPEGRISTYDFDDHGDHHAVQVSAHYGYTIHSGYGPNEVTKAFKAQAFPMFGTLLLLGVITAGVCHWLSRLPRGQR